MVDKTITAKKIIKYASAWLVAYGIARIGTEVDVETTQILTGALTIVFLGLYNYIKHLRD